MFWGVFLVAFFFFLTKGMHLKYMIANNYFKCTYIVVYRIRAVWRLVNSFRSFNEHPGK